MQFFCDVRLGIKEDHYALFDEFGNIVARKRMPIHDHYRACIVHYEMETRGRWKTKRNRVTWFKDPAIAREYFESFGGYSHYKGIWVANPTNTVQTSTSAVFDKSHKLSGGIYRDDKFCKKNRSARR